MKRTQRGAVWLLLFIVVVLQSSVAAAQEDEPTATPAPTPELPLIQDVSLFVLLLVVVSLGVFLLALIAWRISREKMRNSPVPYRPLIEGMVLVMVLVSLTILGVTGKVTQEGLASVLAAIVGPWHLARPSAARRLRVLVGDN